MELTVGFLKKVLSQLDDSVVLADLEYGNEKFRPFLNVKRLLVLKDESDNKTWGGKTFLTINRMGSHFTGKGHQSAFGFDGVYFDKDSFSIRSQVDENNGSVLQKTLSNELRWRERLIEAERLLNEVLNADYGDVDAEISLFLKEAIIH